MSADARVARTGIYLGGTKVEGVVLGRDGDVCVRLRLNAPRDDYGQKLDAPALR